MSQQSKDKRPVYRWGQRTSNHATAERMPVVLTSLREVLLERSQEGAFTEWIFPDSSYLKGDLPPELVQNLRAFCDGVDFIEYAYRGEW